MSAVDGWDKDELARRIRGCFIPVQITSVVDLPSYHCYIVNDILLLSYREARTLYSANKHRNTLYRVISNRFVRWCVIKLYNAFLWTSDYPEYMIVPQEKYDAQVSAETAADASDAANSAADPGGGGGKPGS